ncbi:cell division protein FtsL [Radiobacillus sp. PE A8.2]|uniref:cell division protein FtsL n=1 Tax=Radiobacillus sp. PE A8.2 TaxID=3380349 RepID=UPI003890C76A
MSAEHARNWQQSWEETKTNPTRSTKPKRQVQVKVHKKAWITVGEKVLYSTFAVAMVVALFFAVSFSASADSLNRDVQNLEQQVKQQQELNANLEYKVQDLSNPERILRIAEENGLKIQNSKVKQASEISN